MSSTVERIKERLSIADVVGSYVKLEKAGSNLRARCPFHSEKTPSFFVSPTRNTYYCFGCGAKGDMLSFVQQFEGLDFKGALRILAQRAGVPLTFENPQQRSERDHLYALMEEATSFFHDRLKEGPEAREYLKGRGLSEVSVNDWRIGYAPGTEDGGWRGLHDHLLRKGYTSKEIETAGLARRGEHNYYDLFRGRIMFPIADSSGRVIAFSGRLFPEIPDAPKYVNSPETPLFNKSRTLYGFDKAKNMIRQLNFTLLVEGQMDMVMSHQAGFRNTVALSGTALSHEQVQQLCRLSKNIVLAFDADSAGVTSTGRSAVLALAAGMDVKVAKLPLGVDPADVVKADSGELKAIIRNAAHIIEFYLAILEERAKDKRAYRLSVEERVIPFLARIKSQIDQAHFVNLVAGRLSVPEASIWESVRSYTSTDTEGNDFSDESSSTKSTSAKKMGHSRRAIIEEKLRALFIWQEQHQNQTIDTLKIRQKLVDILGESYTKEMLAVEGEQDSEALLFEAELISEYTPNLDAEIQVLLRELELAYLKDQFADRKHALKEAELEKDNAVEERLLAECKQLSERMSALRSMDTTENL